MDANTLCAAASVSKSWKELAERDDYWSALCLGRWGIAPNHFLPPPDPVKSLYQLHHVSLLRLRRGGGGSQSGFGTRQRDLYVRLPLARILYPSS
jgi:hypothetical protein